MHRNDLVPLPPFFFEYTERSLLHSYEGGWVLLVWVFVFSFVYTNLKEFYIFFNHRPSVASINALAYSIAIFCHDGVHIYKYDFNLDERIGIIIY
jgi:hypothetical protein